MELAMSVTVEPIYAVLAARLRRDITTGKIPRGGKLPSENELAEHEGINRRTVQKAINELVIDGLVVSHKGRGHFVSQRVPIVWRASDPEADAADAWERSVREQGREPAQTIRTETAYADEDVALWLDLEVGDPVSIRWRIQYVDDEPYSTAHSFYPRSIVAGTEVEMPGDVQPGIHAVFDQLGRGWVRRRDRHFARSASREEAAALSIPRGVVVTEVVRRSYDAQDVPVRLTKILLPGDRYVIEYDHREERQ
jgi:GntR family transcriptional regulator